MTSKIKNDIKDILNGYLEEEDVSSVISNISKILAVSEDAIVLATRDKRGNRLKYKGDYYFILKRKKDNKNIIYVGIVTRFDGEKVPTVILSDNNPYFKFIPSEYIVYLPSSRLVGKKGLIIKKETHKYVYDSIVHEVVLSIHNNETDGKIIGKYNEDNENSIYETKIKIKDKQSHNTLENKHGYSLVPIVIISLSIILLGYVIINILEIDYYVKPVNYISENIEEVQNDIIQDQEGNSYKIITIGNQTWLAENLNVTTFTNGDPIQEARTNTDWIRAGKEGKPAWTYYDNNPTHGIKFGKLYNWYAAVDPRGLCPEDWRVPTDSEWTQLINYLGGEEIAGEKMKSVSGWVEGGNGNNSSHFSGLPGGGRAIDGQFGFIGVIGFWWSSSGYESTNLAWCRYMVSTFSSINRDYDDKPNGLSVRCIKD